MTTALAKAPAKVFTSASEKRRTDGLSPPRSGGFLDLQILQLFNNFKEIIKKFQGSISKYLQYLYFDHLRYFKYDLRVALCGPLVVARMIISDFACFAPWCCRFDAMPTVSCAACHLAAIIAETRGIAGPG